MLIVSLITVIIPDPEKSKLQRKGLFGTQFEKVEYIMVKTQGIRSMRGLLAFSLHSESKER